MVITTGSTPYIYIPLTGPDGVDLTALAVEMALMRGGAAPGSSDWQTAVWRAPEAGAAKEVAVQRDLVVWPDGLYMAYVRLHASPELLILPSGRVRIGDTRGTTQ